MFTSTTNSPLLKGRPESVINRFLILIMLAGALMGVPQPGFAQSASAEQGTIRIAGTVRNSAGAPIDGAFVILESKGQRLAELKTNKDGNFVVSVPAPGTYTMRAEKAGLRRAIARSVVLSPGEQKRLNLVLEKLGAGQPNSSNTAPALAGGMEFDERPSFTIAGITDWSGAGGHGSDTSLRTSETLARETRELQANTRKSSAARSKDSAKDDSESKLRIAVAQAPASFNSNRQLGEFYLRAERYTEAIPLLEAAYRMNPGDHGNAYDLALAYKASGDFVRARQHVRQLLALEDKPELHRLLGDLDEQCDDPFGAVREYERAVRLEPSEENYFAWGTELLLHKGVQPAVEVFSKGATAHPDSARMLSGLGAALYAAGSYDEAARRLCDAVDRNPEKVSPYLFLGRMQKAASGPLPCAEQKLAQFVQIQPGNALAHYFYALALWKRDRGSSKSSAGFDQIEAVLEKAASIDPKLGEAHLQLGILYSEHGSTERAITAYQRAIEADTNLGEAHYRLAQAYKRIGEQSKAQREFQLYEQIEKAEAASVERQRRELRQFLVVLREQPALH
jgi:tetratricopeptide (TPR) repeat protein